VRNSCADRVLCPLFPALFPGVMAVSGCRKDRTMATKMETKADLLASLPGSFEAVNDDAVVAFCRDEGKFLWSIDGDYLDCLARGKVEGIDWWCLKTAAVFEPESDVLVHGEPSLMTVSDKVRRELDSQLRDPESKIRRVTLRTINRIFVYFDVSDFSQMPPSYQALVINSLGQTVKHIERETKKAHCIPDYPSQSKDLAIEAKLCIGDGYIFVFRDTPHSVNYAVYFAAQLAHSIQTNNAKGQLPECHFRMSVHIGEVFCFWDLGRNDWNYVGHGINCGRRILEIMGKNLDDVIFISEEFTKKLRANTERRRVHRGFGTLVLSYLDNRGRRKDKHQESHRVYQLNHQRLLLDQVLEDVFH
jgi:hypothetical protein